jgi:hypothetical protein
MFITPRFDFDPAKAALCTSARVFEIQLNRVVFPVLASPIIPQRKGMVCLFWCAKVRKSTKLEVRSTKEIDHSTKNVCILIRYRKYIIFEAIKFKYFYSAVISGIVSDY